MTQDQFMKELRELVVVPVEIEPLILKMLEEYRENLEENVLLEDRA